MSYRISVLISTYDDAALVDKKLDEIQKQSLFEEAEFIFIETASPTCGPCWRSIVCRRVMRTASKSC